MLFKNNRYYSLLLLFGCLLPIAIEAETLHQAWGIAIEYDHGLQAVRENTQASQYQLKAAKSARLPSVTVGAGYTALENDPEAKVNFGGLSTQFPLAERESYSYQAMTVLPLYTGGKISSSIDAAASSLQASENFEAGKVLDLKLDVAETYIGVLRSTKALEVANSHVASLKSHKADVENLYEQGMVSRNDLLAAQVALADAVQSSIQVENMLDISRSAYNRLLGREFQEPVLLDELKPVALDLSLDALMTQAIEQRYELRVLKEQADALNFKANAIRASNAPQVALSGGYDYQENEYQAHEGQWLVGVGMKWTLFDAGLIRNQASATARQARSLEQQYGEVLSLVKLQVRQYWLGVQETRKRLGVTEQSIGQAEENLKVNRDRYEHGLSTNTDVLSAEALRIGSQNNHANAIYDAVLARIRLKRAVSDL
ncbi:MAG: TolC family protein [Cycloclasticus sp.]|nr:TolC family protein [Cycloclasticus sp.]